MACFTRSHVTPDGIESRMEYSTDAGATWSAGNHPVYSREATAGSGAAAVRGR